MLRRCAAVAVASALALGSVVLASPASGAERSGPRVCPAEDFWVGAGWGADRGRRAHAGIDLGGKRGSPIRAIEAGVIDRTKLQSNGALQIVMRGRSGSKFYYGHMDKVLVKGGQRVKAGEVIGLMGDTGSPGSVHLHFEYWRSGGESAAVDPEPLITRVCGLDDSKAPSSPAKSEEPEPVEEPEPEPSRAPAGDASVAGEVFSNS